MFNLLQYKENTAIYYKTLYVSLKIKITNYDRSTARLPSIFKKKNYFGILFHPQNGPVYKG